MKKIFLFTMILLFSQILYTEDTTTTENAPTGKLQLFPNFPKGLNTKQASHLILDDEFQDCGDILFDKEHGGVVRNGFTQMNTSVLSTATIRFMHEYTKTSGNKYLIIVSSNVLAYSVNAITYTILLSTIPTNAKPWVVNYNDICYIGFNNWNGWKFDGTTLMASTNTPQIKYATVYVDKIVGVNVNETNGKSKLKYSDVGYPEVWPALNYIYVDKDDGDELTAIRKYRGNLYAFKKYSIYQMLGLDDGYPTNDGFTKIVSGIGCLYVETMQEKGDGYLYFVSNRGVEQFDGANVNPVPVSDKIDTDIKNLTQLYSDTLVWGETTASDFADGTMVNCNTTTVVGSVSLNNVSTTTVDSTGMMGSFTSIALDSNNRPHISYLDSTDYDLKYASWTGTNWSTSTIESNNIVGVYTSIAISSNNVPFISYLLGDPIYDLKFASWTSIGWATSTIDASSYASASVSLVIDTTTNNPHISYLDSSLIAPNYYLKYASWTGTGWLTSTVDGPGVGLDSSIALDKNRQPCISYYDLTNEDLKFSSHTSAGWVTSTIDSTYDVGRWTSLALDSNNIPHISYIDYTNGWLKYSSYTSTGWTIQKITQGTDKETRQQTSIKINTKNMPCISYTNNMTNYDLLYSYYANGWITKNLDANSSVGYWSSLALDNNDNPYISYQDVFDLDLKCYMLSTGTYTSSKFNSTTADYSWLGWQNFKATENLGTGITMNYYTRTATSTSGLDTASWQQTINNSFSKSDDGSWIQYRFEFIPTVGTNTSRIDDVSIDYGVDSPNKPLVSVVLDRRYMLAGAIKPNINNNIIYCLDQNNNWTKFNNMYVGSFCNFKNELYFGSSTDYFQINKYNEDYTNDNGTAISPFIKTKDYDFGSWINDKYFTDLWTYFEPSTIYSNTTVSFYLNKLSVAEATTSISLVADSTYPNSTIIKRIHNDADRWRYINFKISNFDKWYGLNFKYGQHSEGEK